MAMTAAPSDTPSSIVRILVSLDPIDVAVRRVTSIALAAIGLLLVALLCLSVIGRYAFDLPLAFIEEAARLFLVWFFMLGVGLAYRKKAHVAVELLVDRLTLTSKKGIKVVAHLVGIAFVVHVAAGGFLGLDAASRQVEPTLGISGLWAASAVPCGAVLLVYHQLRMLLEELAGYEGTGPAQ